jgi:hypothetical protein
MDFKSKFTGLWKPIEDKPFILHEPKTKQRFTDEFSSVVLMAEEV